MSLHAVTILHISDLHERGPRESEAWRRRRVLGDGWLSNLDELQKDGPIDLVCFTGDLANTGQAAEYADAHRWLDAALERLHLPRERLFLVPGNHDIDRSVAADAWKRLRETLPGCDAQAVSRWFAGGPAPLGLDDALRDLVLTRQAAYRTFLRDFGLAGLLPTVDLRCRMGFRSTLRLPGRPFELHLLGFDSAWFAGADDDAGKLLLTQDQVMRLATNAAGTQLTGLRIGLVHHPLTDLADGTSCRRLLADHTDVLLRGHQHEPEPERWADPERRLLQLAAGCLYDGHKADQFPNGHQLIRIWTDDAGRPQRYEVRFRAYSARGFWHDDSSLYQSAKQGRLTLAADGRTLTEPKFFVVPLEENPYFTGRDQALADLHAALTSQRLVAVTQRQALSGLGGVGKTQIALAYAYRNRVNYDAVFWLDAASEEILRTGFAAQAKTLNLAGAEAGKSIDTGAMLFKHWLQKNERWLLVLDNADEPAKLKSLLPQNAGGHILLTSRVQDLQSLGIVKPIEVQSFSNAEAVAFLLARTERRDASTAERSAAEELARTLGELPLALEQAAAYIVAQQLPITDYLRSYRSMEHALLARTPTQFGDYRHTVATTWRVNFEQIRPNKNAVAVLRLCALLGAAAIPFDLIRAVASEFDSKLGRALKDADTNPVAFEDVLGPLLRYSIVGREAGARAISMHRLVQAVVRENLLESDERGYAQRLVLPFSRHFPRPEESANWRACEQWIPHALAILDACERFQFVDDASARLHNQVALYLDAHTQDPRAELLFKRAIDRRRRLNASAGADTGNCANLGVALCNLAALYIDRGELKTAEPLMREAVSTIEKREGPDSPFLAMPLMKQAQWLRFCGRSGEAVQTAKRAVQLVDQDPRLFVQNGAEIRMEYAMGLFACRRVTEAERAFAEALAIGEKIHGKNSDVYARLQQQRSDFLRSLGQVQDAEPMARRAFEQARKNFGETHVLYFEAASTLALVLAERGRMKEALELFAAVTRHRLEVHGPVHHRYAEALRNEATCYRGLADYAKAADLAEQAVRINEAANAGPKLRFEHLNELGLIYYAQGRHEDAERVFHRALHSLEQAVGLEHEDVATAYNNMALVHEGQARYALAEVEYQKAADIAKSCLGNQHPDYFLKLHNLAHLRVYQGRYPEAIGLYEQVLAGWKKSYGEVHDKICSCLNGLASAALAAGDAGRAEQYAAESLRVAEQIYAAHHPALAQSMGVLAQCYQAQQQWERASEQYTRSLEALAGAEGGDMLRVSLLNGRGACLAHLARPNEAEAALREALQLRERLLGPRHPELGSVLTELGICCWSQDKLAEAEEYLTRAGEIVKATHGDRHPNYATVLSNMSGLREKQGRSGEAIELARTAASLREELLGPAHPDVALAYSTLAKLQADHAQHAEAELSMAAAQRCRAEQRMSHPHQRVVELLQQGETEKRFGRHREAVHIFEQALQAATAAFGRNSVEHLRVLCSLITLLTESGLVEQAGPHVATADDVAQHIKPLPADARVNHQIVKGGYLFHRGDLAGAEIELQAALAESGLRKQDGTLVAVQARNVLAGIAEARKDYARAEEHYKSAVEHLAGMPAGNERDDFELLTLANRSQMLLRLGRIPEAEAALERARGIADRTLPKLHPRHISLLQRQASCAEKQGDARRELALYQQALTMAEVLWPTPISLCGDLLHGLGEAHGKLGQASEAFTALGKAREIHASTKGAQSNAVREDLVALAQIARRSGEPQRALAYGEQALEISRAARPLIAERLVADTMLLGLCQQAAGDVQAAIALTRATLAEVDGDTDKVMLLYALGGFLRQVDDSEGALESYATAETLFRKRVNLTEAEQSMFAAVLRVHAQISLQTGDGATAGSLLDESIKLHRSLSQPDLKELAKATWERACVELMSGDVAKAEPLAREAFAIAMQSKDAWSIVLIGQQLARVLVASDRRDEALDLLTALRDQLTAQIGASHPLSQEVAESLSALLNEPAESDGDDDEPSAMLEASVADPNGTS